MRLGNRRCPAILLKLFIDYPLLEDSESESSAEMESITFHALLSSNAPTSWSGNCGPMSNVIDIAPSHNGRDRLRSATHLEPGSSHLASLSRDIGVTSPALSRIYSSCSSSGEGRLERTSDRGQLAGSRGNHSSEQPSRHNDSSPQSGEVIARACRTQSGRDKRSERSTDGRTAQDKAASHSTRRYTRPRTISGFLATLPFSWNFQCKRRNFRDRTGNTGTACTQFAATQHGHLPAALSLGLILLSTGWANEHEQPSQAAEAVHVTVDQVHNLAVSPHATFSSEDHHDINPDSVAVDSEIDPHKEGRSLISQAESLTARGDYPAAEIAYRRIMSDRHYPEPEQSDALLGLARMYRKQTVFIKAAAVYEKFLKLYSEDERVPDALLELGRTQRAMGAYRNAINKFYNVINSTLKLPPESYEHYQLLAKTAQFEIAETHFETGNFTEAAKFFDRLRLLDLAPEDRARAHFKAASSLLSAGETEPAAVKLGQYLAQWPTDANAPEARYLLALSLRKLGRTDEALRITLALLKDEHSNAASDPKGWAYWQRRTGNQLANDFFQNGDTLSAASIYESLARLSNDAGWRLPIVYQTGLCYERLRQTDRAIKAYQEVVESAARAQGSDAAAELTELAKMASWRIGQIEWSGQTEKQLHQFFSATLPATPSNTSAPITTTSNDAHASPPATPGSL